MEGCNTKKTAPFFLSQQAPAITLLPRKPAAFVVGSINSTEKQQHRQGHGNSLQKPGQLHAVIKTKRLGGEKFGFSWFSFLVAAASNF